VGTQQLTDIDKDTCNAIVELSIEKWRIQFENMGLFKETPWMLDKNLNPKVERTYELISIESCWIAYLQSRIYSQVEIDNLESKLKAQQELIDIMREGESILERIYRGLEKDISTIPNSFVHKDMSFYFKTKQALAKLEAR
jgi:hypothetical protein